MISKDYCVSGAPVRVQIPGHGNRLGRIMSLPFFRPRNAGLRVMNENTCIPWFVLPTSKLHWNFIASVLGMVQVSRRDYKTGSVYSGDAGCGG